MVLKRWAALESSAKMLLISNLATFIIAIIFRWSILTLIWGYWLQSLVIGFFTVAKLIIFRYRERQKRFFLKSIRDALFFTLHYGIFHVIYLSFLYYVTTSESPSIHLQQPNYLGIAFIGILFFINHLYSFLKNYVWEKKIIVPSSNQIFLEPYKRIFPMQLTIIAAGFFSAIIPSAETPLIIVFLLLKTLADLKSHEVMHQSDTYPTFRRHPQIDTLK
jgi:hypothetical protein